MSERTELSRERISQIPEETTVREPFRDFFARTARFILSVTPDADNRALYEDILPENYASSYACPDYAAEKLGAEAGPILSAVYAEIRGLIPAVFEGDEETEAILLELFLGIYFEYENDAVPEVRVIKKLFSSYITDYTGYYVRKQAAAALLPEGFAHRNILKGGDGCGDYLESFGEYITDDTRKIYSYLESLPEETIDRMAGAFTEGYRMGFINARKDLSKKKTVQVIYELGYDRMIRRAAERFAEMGLDCTFARSSPYVVTRTANRHAGYTGAVPSPQFDYDHKEDLAIVLDRDYVSLRKRTSQEAYEELKEAAAVHGGPAVMETFGEDPFSPAPSKCAIKFDDTQKELYSEMRRELLMIRQRYIPEKERSFTIIDFPVPAVGERFEEIFDETIKLNTLDSSKYSRIQQHIIDALDKGTSVRILGRGGNRTDMTVALTELRDPSKQTLFENCVADVNIPVGEVFTSPRLMGTNGTLHVSRVFLDGLNYVDLEITFKEGMTESVSCANFDDEERNRSYIEENVLFHHPSLPLGEFAIGTNTTAYVMMRKFGIEERMPILISEKAGPHFAIGDTCYMMAEDEAVFNPDGKEIIARENERSAMRKTDPSAAYFGCHTDITIPYDELGSVTVISRDGNETDIIRDGRFVLPGTEELNIPLDEE